MKISSTRIIVFGGLTLLAVVIRAARFLPNVSPVGGLSLLSGTVLPWPWAAAVPVLTMLLSDALIGFYSWPVMASVYGSFVAMVYLGVSLRNSRSVVKVVAVTLLSSVMFFLVTNLAVWWFSGMYEHSLAGMALCYYLALPFFRNSLLGNLAYSSGIFLVWWYLPAAVVAWFRYIAKIAAGRVWDRSKKSGKWIKSVKYD